MPQREYRFSNEMTWDSISASAPLVRASRYATVSQQSSPFSSRRTKSTPHVSMPIDSTGPFSSAASIPALTDSTSFSMSQQSWPLRLTCEFTNL